MRLMRILGVAMAVQLAANPIGAKDLGSTPKAEHAGAGFKVEVLQLPTPKSAASAKGEYYGEPLAALLYTPPQGDNRYGPAIVMLDDGPGSQPENPSEASRFAAERLAAKGYTVLSIFARMERSFGNDRFEDSAIDIDTALSYLEATGHEDLILAGQGAGSTAVSYYVATNPDPMADYTGVKRVKATIHFAPGSDHLIKEGGFASEADYQAKVALAQSLRSTEAPAAPEAKRSAPRVFVGHYPFVQSPESFLDYYGPDSVTSNTVLFEKLAVPTLLLAGDKDPAVTAGRLEALKAAAVNSPGVDIVYYPGAGHAFEGAQQRSADDAANWLAKIGYPVTPRVKEEVVSVKTDDGSFLPGTLYLPEAGANPGRPAFILQHGTAGDNLQSAAQWLGWRLARAGYPALSINVRLAGATGNESGTIHETMVDTGKWMDFLAGRGFKRVILEGHSLGGNIVSNYKSTTQDPRVIGMVYIAPTRDSASYQRGLIGADVFDPLMKEAQDAVARGEGDTHLLPNGRFARGWVDYVGPEPHRIHTALVKSIAVPGLVFAGTKDPLMDRPFIDGFKSAYKGPLDVIWSEGGTHPARERKNQLTAQLLDWTHKTFPQ